VKFTTSNAMASAASAPLIVVTVTCSVAMPAGSIHEAASQVRNVARASAMERSGRPVMTGVNWCIAPSTPIDRVARTPKCVVTTIGSVVGAGIPAPQAQMKAMPQAMSRRTPPRGS